MGMGLNVIVGIKTCIPTGLGLITEVALEKNGINVLRYNNIYIYSILFKSLYVPQGLCYQHLSFTTLYLYGKIYFGVLHKPGADITRSDTPNCSKPPHLQVGAFELLFGLFVERSCHYWFVLFVNFILSITEISLCEVNAHFPTRFVPIISPYISPCILIIFHYYMHIVRWVNRLILQYPPWLAERSVLNLHMLLDWACIKK